MSLVTNEVNVEQLRELDKKHVFHPVTSLKQHQENGPTLIIKEGKGIHVTDVNGKQYIDGLSSLWNVNIGHGREELAEVAKEQMTQLAYSSSFQGMSHEPAIRLAEKIASLTPGDLNVSFFTSGGSESNDSAFKIARHYWKLKGKPERNKIVAMKRGYHGITIGATSATGIEQFQNMATAQAPGFVHATTRFNTNCELGDRTDPDFAGSFRGVIEKEGPETVAAVILEPVQGAGGLFIPQDGYLQALRKLCDEYGILMITDEVITGFGRTGKMFGVDNWDVVPDLMSVAKGITSGYSQLGAVIIRESLRDELAELSGDGMFFHGFTYSGHPVACSVALKNLEIIEREDLVANAKNMETVLKKGFAYLEEKHPIFTKSRALGLMAAFELYKDRDNEIPFDPSLAVAPRFVQECTKRGLIIRPVIFEGSNTIVMAPPLTITEEQVEQMIAIFDESLTEIATSIS